MKKVFFSSIILLSIVCTQTLLIPMFDNDDNESLLFDFQSRSSSPVNQSRCTTSVESRLTNESLMELSSSQGSIIPRSLSFGSICSHYSLATFEPILDNTIDTQEISPTILNCNISDTQNVYKKRKTISHKPKLTKKQKPTFQDWLAEHSNNTSNLDYHEHMRNFIWKKTSK